MRAIGKAIAGASIMTTAGTVTAGVATGIAKAIGITTEAGITTATSLPHPNRGALEF